MAQPFGAKTKDIVMFSDPLSELSLKSFGFQGNIKIAVISISEHTALKSCLTPALMNTEF